MGFIREYVPREDWDLYNSFELVNKSINIGQKIEANEHSFWKVDKEREVFFVMTGVIGREEIEYYTLVLKGKKVNIVADFERRFIKGMQKGYKVRTIIADEELRNRENEYLALIKEALSVGREKSLDFIEFSEPVYRKEIK